MCHKFIKDGEKSCKKGSDCKYVHPKLCIRSLNTKECLKVTCSFYHVAGTRRNSDDKQTPQKLMSINTGMPANQHIPAFSTQQTSLTLLPNQLLPTRPTQTPPLTLLLTLLAHTYPLLDTSHPHRTQIYPLTIVL